MTINTECLARLVVQLKIKNNYMNELKTLEDVLRVCEKNNVNIYIDSYGDIYEYEQNQDYHNGAGYTNRNIKWIFGKTLDEQSQETIDFLTTLLKK